jgi:hypothetical protein
VIKDLGKEAVRATAATEPMRFDEVAGRKVCQFCGSHGGHEHEADCVWVACKNAVASWPEGTSH